MDGAPVRELVRYCRSREDLGCPASNDKRSTMAMLLHTAENGAALSNAECRALQIE